MARQYPRQHMFPAVNPLVVFFWVPIIIGLSTMVLYWLHDVIKLTAVILLYLVPVGLIASVWGLIAGVAAALLASLALNFFFTEPVFTLSVSSTEDLLALTTFLAVAFAMNWIVGQLRSRLASVTLRERGAMHLLDLSTVIAGLLETETIAQTLAQHILDTFGADRVEVVIDSGDGPQVEQVSRRTGSQAAEEESTNMVEMAGSKELIPIQTARGLLGEARVWRVRVAFTPTERRLLEAFAGQCGLALERARLAQADTRARVLEESDRMKSTLLSSVSHELRTPLATIKAAVTSLSSEAVSWDSAARDDLLAVIEEETDHLNELVGNLLNMSRIEAGALKPDREWNILAEILNNVIRRSHFRSSQIPPEGSHRIEIDLPADLPLVPVDWSQMEQVFTNLITNSMKYAPSGSRIRITARKVPEDAVLVEVSNEGPGVPGPHLERIFEKFHRVTDTDRITGTGLGLSICKGIVEAHGGRIWAENLPGGFAFKFTLPLTWEGAQPRVPIE